MMRPQSFDIRAEMFVFLHWNRAPTDHQTNGTKNKQAQWWNAICMNGIKLELISLLISLPETLEPVARLFKPKAIIDDIISDLCVCVCQTMWDILVRFILWEKTTALMLSSSSISSGGFTENVKFSIRTSIYTAIYCLDFNRDSHSHAYEHTNKTPLK